MDQGLAERTNNFNLRRHTETKQIFGTYELGSQSQIVGKTEVFGSKHFDTNLEACGKIILEMLHSAKVDKLETTIESIQSESDAEIKLEALDQKEIAELVNKLNEGGGIFKEGVSLSFTDLPGKERK